MKLLQYQLSSITKVGKKTGREYCCYESDKSSQRMLESTAQDWENMKLLHYRHISKIF